MAILGTLPVQIERLRGKESKEGKGGEKLGRLTVLAWREESRSGAQGSPEGERTCDCSGHRGRGEQGWGTLTAL